MLKSPTHTAQRCKAVIAEYTVDYNNLCQFVENVLGRGEARITAWRY